MLDFRTASNPRPKWPDGARNAFIISFDADGPATAYGNGRVPYGSGSNHFYMYRRGLPRVLDVLEEFSIKATFFVLGHDVERYPEVYRDIHAAGHEIASHGYLHESDDLGDKRDELVIRTHNAIADCVGVPPAGFRATGGYKAAGLLELLASLGCIYDSGQRHVELPYFPKLDGKPQTDFIELPTSIIALNDAQVLKFLHTTAAEIQADWIAEYDAAAAMHGYYMYILHPVSRFGAVTPARVKAWRAVMRHALAQGDVSFLTMQECARHCLATKEQWSAE